MAIREHVFWRHGVKGERGCLFSSRMSGALLKLRILHLPKVPRNAKNYGLTTSNSISIHADFDRGHLDRDDD